MKRKFNLQLFSEGAGDGAGEGAAGAEGTQAAAETNKGRKSNPLANVVYGKQEEAQDDNVQGGEDDVIEEPQEESFEDLIKGKYREEFSKKTQSIINKRFAETKTLEEQVNSMQPILNALAKKYNVDASDAEALLKAFENDDALYEAEAIEKGLTVDQVKDIRRMENHIEQMRTTERQLEKAQQIRQFNERINSQTVEAQEYYPNLKLEEEMQNDSFKGLLRAGIDVKTAYEVIHKDEIVSGAMQYTAQKVSEKMANNIQSRAKRPAENGTSSRAAVTVKSDVSKLTKADREEIERRVMRGEKISF